MRILLIQDRNMANDYIRQGVQAMEYFVQHQFPKDDHQVCITQNISHLPWAELVIMFGVYQKRKGNTLLRKKVFDYQKTHNRPLIIIEKGFLKREDYYSIGYNSNVGFGYYHNQQMPIDRWLKLGIPIQPRQINSDGYILFCYQVEYDTQVQHINYIEWATQTLIEMKKYTQRQIIFRPHPWRPQQAPPGLDIQKSRHAKIEDDLKEAWAVVTFNSNSALDALLAGIPIFVFDRGSLVYDIANHDLKNLDQPDFPDEETLKQTLANIAYTQWREDEIRSGEFWSHLENGLEASLDHLKQTHWASL